MFEVRTTEKESVRDLYKNGLDKHLKEGMKGEGIKTERKS
jgi:hypothetical protein